MPIRVITDVSFMNLQKRGAYFKDILKKKKKKKKKKKIHSVKGYKLINTQCKEISTNK